MENLQIHYKNRCNVVLASMINGFKNLKTRQAITKLKSKSNSKIVSGNHYWSCKRSSEWIRSEVPRLKQHLVEGYPDIMACKKCLQKVCQLFRQPLRNFKKGKRRSKEKQHKLDRSIRPLSYHSKDPANYEASNPDDMEGAWIHAAIHMNKKKQWRMDEMAKYRAQSVYNKEDPSKPG